mmetsp:Transcript_12077/g.31009  ORF Transcript_12077/g.31009 Transcript_12077/m.31009 type:complete len:312 (+) Transcript_12077:178-1113(+)
MAAAIIGLARMLAAVLLLAHVVTTLGTVPHSACRDEPGGGGGCALSHDFLTARVRSATAHPSLYKELALDEVRCSQHAAPAPCLQRRGHCRWDGGKGCVALNAVAGFQLQVALCEEGAVQPAKYTDLMTELQVETAVATECSMFQSRDDCLSALDGTCDWRPDLEFSQDPRSCVLKGITFDTTQTRLALHECAATITSSLAHFRYHNLYSLCGDGATREQCMGRSGCAWRMGTCQPSYSVLMEPIEYIGTQLASDIRRCEQLDATNDGCDSEVWPEGRSPQASPTSGAVRALAAVPLVWIGVLCTLCLLLC